MPGPEEPIDTLPLEVVQVAVAQLDQATHNHDQWHRNLLRVMVARLPPDAADLQPDAHRRCLFGQWLDSDAVGSLRNMSAFVALGDAHRNMHASARALLQRVEDDLPIQTRDLDQFNNLLDHLRLELDSLRSVLAETVQNRDPLTDARNRTGLLPYLREQHALVRRGRSECSVVMMDLDHFKEVNDRLGHRAGDEVLRAFVHGLQTGLRSYDRLYRYGGEEFLLAAAHTAPEEAVELAERLRVIIETRSIAVGTGDHVHISASFGVAALDAARSVEESLEQADAALYRAKGLGRNRVEHQTVTASDS